MRIITDKDRQGLAAAARALVRNLGGERIGKAALLEAVDKAVDAGISMDAILNKENWGRALEISPELTFRQYIDILCDRAVDLRELKDEPMWHETANRFDIVAEAAHDFYMEVCGEGGKWNIPSALVNLAKAVRQHSLQAILSEKLIEEVCKAEEAEKLTYFAYVDAIVRDFNSLPVEDGPTEAQAEREKETEDMIRRLTGEQEQQQPEGEAAPEETESEDDPDGTGDGDAEQEKGDKGETADLEPEPENEPDWEDENDPDPPYEPEEDPERFGKHAVMYNNPNSIKRDSLIQVMMAYKPSELAGIIGTIDGGMDLPLFEIVKRLVYGQFDPKKEDFKTREIHQSINQDLMLSYLDCVRSLPGVTMTEDEAAKRDILRESWDLSSPRVRKLNKLLMLIYTEGKDDPDLLEAADDIEHLYGETDEDE